MAHEKSVIEGRAIQSGQTRTDPARDAAGGEKSAGDFKFELFLIETQQCGIIRQCHSHGGNIG